MQPSLSANPVPLSRGDVGQGTAVPGPLARLPIVLCFGGTDPSGGAGLPADARAVAAFGAHSCGIVTAVVAQNTRGAVRSDAVPVDFVRAQLETLLQDVAPDAVKTGLLASPRQVELVAACAQRLGVPLVVDTVFAPSTGVRFCDEGTVRAVRELLLPRCDVVTPNRGEAETLCGFALNGETDVKRAARLLLDSGAGAVLLKGGHFEGDAAVDWLAWRNGANEIGETALSAPRLAFEVRGTGCQLAAAIAAQRACGVAIEVAAARAKSWLWHEMQAAAAVGGGRRVTVGHGAHHVHEENL